MAKILLLLIAFSQSLFATVHVFGDSHSRMFTGFPNTKIHHLGPVTMHRAGRDNQKLISLNKFNVRKSDIVVMVFGEIDMRCHIKKIAEKANKSPDIIIQDLVNRFGLGVQTITKSLNPHQVVICEIIPPIDISKDPARAKALRKCSFPVIGTTVERVHYNKTLNHLLKAECDRYGFTFFKYSHKCKNAQDCLDTSFADTSVHIHQNYRYKIQNAFKQLQL